MVLLRAEKRHHKIKSTNPLLSAEQTWPSFPLCWTTLVEMQKIRSMLNFHPWTSLISWPSVLAAVLSNLPSPDAHLSLFPSACSIPSSHPPGSGTQRFHGSGVELDDLYIPSRPFCDSVINHIWLSTSNSPNSMLWSFGMGSATRKRIQDKLRCFIQAASHSVALQLALSSSLQLCTNFSKLISVINT